VVLASFAGIQASKGYVAEERTLLAEQLKIMPAIGSHSAAWDAPHTDIFVMAVEDMNAIVGHRMMKRSVVELSVKDLKCAKPQLTRAGVVKLQSYGWPGQCAGTA
jgi:hypothetical protein